MIHACISCKFWVMNIPPAIGKCKKFNKTVVNADKCPHWTELKSDDNFINDFLKGFAGGKK